MMKDIRAAANQPQSAWSVGPFITRALAFAVVAGSWACSAEQTATAPMRSLSAGRSNASSAATQEELIPGEYIVTFVDTVKDAPGLAKKLAGEHGSSPKFTYESALKGFAAKLSDHAVAALEHNPVISAVEPDQFVRLEAIQSTAPWGLDRIDQRQYPLDRAYSYANTGAGVTVYFIDSGIRRSHLEFTGRVGSGFSLVNDGNGVEDCYGHGTHVAGIIGGTTWGIAKQVTLQPVRVFGCTGSGTMSAVISAVDWITANRVLPAVANMSLGGGLSSTLNSAVQNSINAGVVYAVSAGNSSVNACNYSPGSVPAALTVGASSAAATGITLYDIQDSYSNFGSCVDLYAPGNGIRSASYASDSGSTLMTGTSMAAPAVAGAAALVLSAYPGLPPATVAKLLVDSATAGIISGIGTGSPNRLLYTGFVGAAGSIPTPAPTSPPPANSPTPVTTTAQFSVACSRSSCAFDASASTGNGSLTRRWNFGDGSQQTSTAGATATHSYGAKGTYQVQLEIIDGLQQRGSTVHTATVKRAP